MKVKFLFLKLEEGRYGFTFIEVLISIIVFTFVCLSAVLVSKNIILSSRKISFEKDILREISHISEFIENTLSNAMINNLSGKYRMNFKGETTWVRFVAPFSETEEGDIAKFGIFYRDNKIMVEMVRVDRKNPDFEFYEGFPGAQILGENVSFFSLKYYDGENWLDNWDTENMVEPELPELVEIKIKISKGKIEGKEIEKEITKITKIGEK